MMIPPELSDPELMTSFPMAPGDALFFHSLVPHYTCPNSTDKWRHAITLSYMRSESTFSTAHLEHLGTKPTGVTAGSTTGEDPGPVYFPVAGATLQGCVR